MPYNISAGNIFFDMLWPSHICVKQLNLKLSSQWDSLYLKYANNISKLKPLIPELESIELTAIEVAQKLSLLSGNCDKIVHIDSQIVVWDHNSHVSFYSSTSKFIALYCISTKTLNSIPTGEIAIHDPRAGAGNISLPGFPFGRPITIKPNQGSFLVIPGWLGYSSTPLGINDEHILLSMELT